MKIAFLNLCHCDPMIVARVANKLNGNKNFSMYIHVDAKQEITPFQCLLPETNQVHYVVKREKVYWGGFSAIVATINMLKEAMASEQQYEYFVLLQNLDYPIKSNREIEDFFIKSYPTEFIRGCNIAKSKDWHYKRKYKLYNKRDIDFYLTNHTKARRNLHNMINAVKSITTILNKGCIKEGKETFDLFYGAAQWAITRKCAQYIIDFYESHQGFNQRMSHIQFPDEEYFHTIVHNSMFKHSCVAYDEPEKRWLVNWRNLHYFEYPKEITVFTEKDFERILQQKECLFCRKVRSGVSDQLMDKLDEVTENVN